MSGVPFAILRHASTAWNEERRLQGLTDTTLSATGEADARSWRLPPPAAGWLRVSSPLQRARRTAELLQPSVAVTVDSALREVSFGVWEGHTIAELRREVGEAFLAEERKGLDFQPPGGESPRSAMARIGGWAARIAGTGRPVVAVSHKAAIRALLALATAWDMTGRPPHKLDWRSVHFFTARPDGSVAVDRLNVPLTGEQAGTR
jgi:broad specificity phosphatase PhoE